MGAGLGGGSSDAAATIIGLNRLLQLEWSRRQMAEIGQLLGSDVPFFLFAPSAVVAGRGEASRARRSLEGSAMGRAWSTRGSASKPNGRTRQLAATREVIRPLSPGHARLDQHEVISWPQLAAAAENDFEAPVFAAHAMLREIKQTLRAQGRRSRFLSGSGATVFGVFHDESAAHQAHTQFARDTRLNVFVVSTCSKPLSVAVRTGAEPAHG